MLSRASTIMSSILSSVLAIILIDSFAVTERASFNACCREDGRP